MVTFGQKLYSFSTATKTNSPELRGLKHHRFIFFQCRRPEVQNGSYWAKVKVWAGLVSSGGSKRESVSLLFSASRSHLDFLAYSPFAESLHPLASLVASPALRHLLLSVHVTGR